MMPVLAALVGCLAAAGVWALLMVRVQPQPRLNDAFDLLDGRRPEGTAAEPGVSRLGAWVRTRSGLVVGDGTQRRLRMVGIGLDRHIAHKAVGALVGALVPALLAGWLSWMVGAFSPLPVLVVLAGGVLGFIWPDLRLRQRDQAVTADAAEALLTYVDLVTLERLANRSGTQALHSAATVSDVMVFRAISDVLERTRLEQRPPYAELQRLGAELELPALVDIADVMRLDEAGAALSGTLRARVRELRDAHLTAMKVRATEISERMGVLMVVPTLLFGLLFLVPPLLRLLGD
ncbi:MAG: hypothetical protein KIT69_16000 [Propionibacteriaceae bacterium]|nr:hypothetical protein [Propionibacteriaceae bacterium]